MDKNLLHIGNSWNVNALTPFNSRKPMKLTFGFLNDVKSILSVNINLQRESILLESTLSLRYQYIYSVFPLSNDV